MSGRFTRQCALPHATNGAITVAGAIRHRQVEVLFQHPVTQECDTFIHNEADGRLAVRLAELGIPFEDTYVETRVLPDSIR